MLILMLRGERNEPVEIRVYGVGKDFHMGATCRSSYMGSVLRALTLVCNESFGTLFPPDFLLFEKIGV